MASVVPTGKSRTNIFLEQPNPPPKPDSNRKTLVLYWKRADEKSVGPRESHNGALSIKPFERSRVTTV